MSNLMRISGIILVAAAILIVLLLKFSSAQMQILGITPEIVATLLVGGILSLGLGGVISALGHAGSSVQTISRKVAAAVEAVEEEVETAPLPKMDFTKKRFDTVSSAPAPTPPPAQPPIAPAKSPASTSVADTIAALEQAKSDIKTALGGVESMTDPIEPPTPAYVSSPPPPPPAPEPEAEEEPAEGELFVVEEKIIRGRPARILSDDTVEAETDEGWMRFENLEHLNEYLDSLEEGDA